MNPLSPNSHRREELPAAAQGASDKDEKPAATEPSILDSLEESASISEALAVVAGIVRPPGVALPKKNEQEEMTERVQLFLKEPNTTLDFTPCKTTTDCTFLQLLFKKATSEQLHTIVQALVKDLPQLDSFDFKLCRVTPETILLLQNCKNVRKLSLQSLATACGGPIDITDAHLTAVGKLSNLTNLNLYGGGTITSAGFQALQCLPLLEELNLMNCLIGPSECEHISRMLHLKSLTVYDIILTEKNLQLLIASPSLESLSFSYCQLPDTALKFIADGKKLKKLDFSASTLAEDDLPAFAELQSLTELRLESCRVRRTSAATTPLKDADLQHLAALTQIRLLDLTDAAIDGSGLQHLSRMTLLEDLGLTFSQVTDNALQHLSCLTHLQKLGLSCCRLISDAGAIHLGRLAELRVLYIHGTSISDAGLGHLTGLLRLQELALGGSLISNAGLLHVASLKTLTRLCLDNTSKVDDEGLRNIQALTAMQDLALCRIRCITSAGLQHLLQMTELRKLNLSQTAVDNASFAFLLQFKKLETLDLRNTQVQIGDLMLHFVRQMEQLTQLDLNGLKRPETIEHTIAAILEERRVAAHSKQRT